MAGEFGRLRWSGAMREAFLRGLAAHGGVRRACRETGMSIAGAYDLRRRDADFARLWDKAIERAGAERAERLASAARASGRGDGMFRDYRPRHDGWTERRTRIFLRALGETGCVRDACARAGISNVSAYRMRARDAGFAQAWARALARAQPTIEQAAFERAVEGWDEVVTREGREISRRRRYSDSLLRLLLQRGDLKAGRAQAEAETGAGGYRQGRKGVPPEIAAEEETNAALLKNLAALKRQLSEKEERAAAARREEGSAHWKAEWEKWKPGWDAPAPDGPQLRLIGPE